VEDFFCYHSAMFRLVLAVVFLALPSIAVGLYTGKSMTYKIAIAAFTLIILSGCTTPAVDRETANFDAEKFSQDLEFCRGGTATAFTLKTVSGTLYGSAMGAWAGLYLGVVAGDGAEGA